MDTYEPNVEPVQVDICSCFLLDKSCILKSTAGLTIFCVQGLVMDAPELNVDQNQVYNFIQVFGIRLYLGFNLKYQPTRTANLFCSGCNEST